MQYDSLDTYLTAASKTPPKGPLAVIIAEDAVEIGTTLRHHLHCGFNSIVLLAPAAIPLDDRLAQRVTRVDFPTAAENATCTAINGIVATLPEGTWVYYGYNAEYLFYPFCETRTVGEMLTFHEGERRDAMLTYVVDLYAGDLTHFENAVSLEDAYLDRSGYFALARRDTASESNRERQLDFFGGLRWRFEEHVPQERRRIDRIALFRSRSGLELQPDHTFNDPEYNTFACPWHHSLTAAVCSFRTAKALRTNPESRYAIGNFRWRNSMEFEWHSQQLLDLGLMEPGQWF